MAKRRPPFDLFLRVLSALVPRLERPEWLDEWRGELEALERERAAGASGLPGTAEFVVGAIPHAVWMRVEGWSMDGLMQDARYSLRMLRRAPGFAIVAALTLALGIGANASIFSLINGLVLRSPPAIQEVDRLVQIGRSFEEDPKWDSWSWPAMRVIAEEGRVFSDVAGSSGEAFVLGRGETAERVFGRLVTGNYFGLLGVNPHIGRLIQPSDDVEPGGHRVLVLSHDLWVRRYGSDPDIVNRSVDVGGTAWEIIGVTPPGFVGIENVGFHPEVYAPSVMNAYIEEVRLTESWGWSWLDVVGRLEGEVTFAEARASMDVVASRLRSIDTVHDGIVVELAEGIGLDPVDRSEAARLSVILAVIVVLVFLLTCTNVANLFLSRASGRTTEVGVRRALGAGNGRLVRQFLTEGSLLAVLAIVLALPLVFAAGELLPRVMPYQVSVSLAPDARVFTFLLVIGIVAGLTLSVAPAWATLRSDTAQTLREGSSTVRRGKSRLQNALVVSQLALSLALVTGAALLGRSVLNAYSADPGFEARGLSAGFVGLYATGRYDRESGQAFYRSMYDAARSLPGVEHVTLASQLPLVGGQSRASVRPVGREDVSFEAEYNIVGPGYFETLGIPVLRGRALRGFDDEPEQVVVINEALATLFWPGEDPIGQELAGEPAWRVVGVVADVQSRSLRRPGNPAVYYPIAHQYLPWSMALVVGSGSGEARAPEAVRSVIASLDPDLPPAQVVDVQATVVDTMSETRTIGYLVSTFAGLALFLAVVGLYGLVSYGASQRVREFGIRIALGAEPSSLTRLILGRGVAISVLGIAVGGVVTYGLGRALGSLLFRVSSMDIPTFVAASVVLLLSAALAAWIPARRASRVDAAISLRD
ncbi:MAG: ABC transporter permease [Gemmatimonadetes bacterium]|nr:ABC transporter permease [Gemmatimonadota bacterium]